MPREIPFFQVDAFTTRAFAGNPAAVFPLPAWLPDPVMQAIAGENNLSETAFFVPEGDGFGLRWFTPTHEVDLCGHATLASAFVVFDVLEPARERIAFTTRSGVLTVERAGKHLVMDFPSIPPSPLPAAPAALAAALGAAPVATLGARSLVAVFEDAEAVRRLRPDLGAVAALDWPGVIVTAPGDGEADFVSRFFAPRLGVPEDPVTGSAHCTLAPYWGGRLGKSVLRARQVSARGGELICELRGERVAIEGDAVMVIRGTISLPG
ncbi:MAG TPA: PhzF family phenazine biosynthesis protein [Polyangia bacterium]